MTSASVPPPSRGVARIFFAGFALLLFTMTHWPALKVPGTVPRGDLYIHATAFFTWTSLLLASRFFAPSIFAPRNVWLCLAIGITYAGFDELTQMIPILNRTAAWDDFGADCAGVLLASFCALFLSRRKASRTDSSTASTRA